MLRSLAAAALAPALAALVPTPAAAQDDPHAAFDAFLAEYVVERDGMTLLRYGAVTEADAAALEGYIDALEAMTPSEFGPDAQLAYYFNLYNAAIIDVVLDNYPIESIKEVGSGVFNRGPWKDEVVTVEGEALSFDDIEHGIVRARFDEPRVHYAFNCASIGCPDIRPAAWRADTLSADLDDAARAYVASDRGVRVDGRGRVTASSIYKWFQEDFGGDEEGVLEHVSAYATGAKQAALDEADGIRRYDYDWSLNEAE